MAACCENEKKVGEKTRIGSNKYLYIFRQNFAINVVKKQMSHLHPFVLYVIFNKVLKNEKEEYGNSTEFRNKKKRFRDDDNPNSSGKSSNSKT